MQAIAIQQRGRQIVLSVLLAWCIALIGIRVARTGSDYFLFLIWNLFLATVPVLLARLLRIAHRRRTADIAQFMLVVAWLLFLPNAPYIFTDFVHLHASTRLLYSYDLVLLLSCAGTGLLLGYASLMEVHTIFTERFGRVFGWSFAAFALMLCGYGVYLGRVQRWNSWDVIANPRELFDDIADVLCNPSQHLQVYAYSGFISIVLLLGYAALHTTLEMRASRVAE